MINIMVTTIKGLLIILWGLTAVGILNMSPLSQTYQDYVFVLAAGVLLVHLIEYYYLRVKFVAETAVEMNFMQTMLWGFGYWLPLLKRNT